MLSSLLLFLIFFFECIFFDYATLSGVTSWFRFNLVLIVILLLIPESNIFRPKLVGVVVLSLTFSLVSVFSVAGLIEKSRFVGVVGVVGFSLLVILFSIFSKEYSGVLGGGASILKYLIIFVGVSVFFYLMANGEWVWPFRRMFF